MSLPLFAHHCSARVQLDVCNSKTCKYDFKWKNGRKLFTRASSPFWLPRHSFSDVGLSSEIRYHLILSQHSYEITLISCMRNYTSRSWPRLESGNYLNVISVSLILLTLSLFCSITVLTPLWLYVCQYSYSTARNTWDHWSKLSIEDYGRETAQLQIVRDFAFNSFLKYVLITNGLMERDLNSVSSISLRKCPIFSTAGTDWRVWDLFVTFLTLSRQMLCSEHSFSLSNHRQQFVSHASSCHTNLLKWIQLFYPSFVGV
jgi:hypothetical protein